MAKKTTTPNTAPAQAGKAQTARQRRRRGSHDSSGLLPLLVLGIIVLGFISPYTSMLILFFMIPTFVLAFTGRDAYQNDRLLTVMLMNLAGILPFAMEVWRRPEMIEYVLFDMIKIATMLGAAGVGYGLLWVCPFVASIVLQSLSQDRLAKIAARRKELVELYGPEVLSDGDAPIKS